MIPLGGLDSRLGEILKEHAPPAAMEFLRLLLDNGYAVWAVGGIIRDAAYSFPVTDIDIVTDKDPIQLADSFARKHSLGFVTLDDERRIARIVFGPDSNLKTLDAAMAQGASIDEDLRRRDFTVNAVSARFDGKGFTINDPLGGLADLESKTLRPVSPSAMLDDPVRVLRARRFEVSHCLTPSPEIRPMAARAAPLLADVPGERISQELFHILRTPSSHNAIKAMDVDGSLDVVFPELIPARGCVQNEWHHLDVFDHSVETLARMEEIIANPPEWLSPWMEFIGQSLREEVSGGWTRLMTLKLAALLHDVGKPASANQLEAGKRTFYGHEKISAELAIQSVNRLRLPGAVRGGVSAIVKNHLRPFNAIHEGSLTERAVYRFHRDLGEWTVPALIHAVADALATQGPAVTTERRSCEWNATIKVLEYAKRVKEAPPSVPPLLNGRDIMEITNEPPGPMIGHLVRVVEEARALGEIKTREEAATLVKRELAQGKQAFS